MCNELKYANIIVDQERVTDKIGIIPVLLLFVIIYGFSISGVDMRYPALMCCAFFLFFTTKRVVFPIEILKLLMMLLAFSLYSLVISTLKQTGDFFETFRYLRCMASTIVILLLVWKYDITPQKMMNILKILLLLNAISVIIGIVWPEFKNLILPISQYYKMFTPYRSSGLLNGQDAAGFCVMFGLVLETLEKILYKKNFLSISLLVYVIASPFTSRFTIAFVVLVLVIDFVISYRKRSYKQALILFLLLIPIFIVGAVFWIMTTNVAPELRYPILSAVPSLKPLFVELSGSYIDYGVHTSAMSRHADITDLHFAEFLFGAGYRTIVKQDIGYIKTIYAIGILGVCSQMLFYLRSVKEILWFRRSGCCVEYISTCYVVLVILLFVWESKMSFVFSSVFFELLMCIYISVLYSACHEKKLTCVFLGKNKEKLSRIRRS